MSKDFKKPIFVYFVLENSIHRKSPAAYIDCCYVDDDKISSGLYNISISLLPTRKPPHAEFSLILKIPPPPLVNSPLPPLPPKDTLKHTI